MDVAELRSRIVADIRDRASWTHARARGLGASDAASWAKEESAPSYLRAKLYNPFEGSAYTRHGNAREAHILAAFGMPQNHYLFRSAGNPRHLATPDGLLVNDAGALILGQAKTHQIQHTKDGAPKPAFTSAKGERLIPPTYKRQMWWEQYVLGADRTLFMWEPHDRMRPALEPESCWFYRDDDEIAKLVRIANIITDGMDYAEQFRKELFQ